jgi:hypothetical protein
VPLAVQKQVAERPWRESAASPDWVGNAVAKVLDLHVESAPDKTRIKSFLKTWIKSGALRVVEKPDATRRNRKFVEVGQWVID